MAKNDEPEVYVATETFMADVDGQQIDVKRGVTRVHRDHPLYAQVPNYFEPVVDHAIGGGGVEDMTADPGAKRGAPARGVRPRSEAMRSAPKGDAPHMTPTDEEHPQGQRPPEDAADGSADPAAAWGGTIDPAIAAEARATDTAADGGRRADDPQSGGRPPDPDVEEPTARIDPAHGQRTPDGEPGAKLAEKDAPQPDTRTAEPGGGSPSAGTGGALPGESAEEVGERVAKSGNDPATRGGDAHATGKGSASRGSKK